MFFSFGKLNDRDSTSPLTTLQEELGSNADLPCKLLAPAEKPNTHTLDVHNFALCDYASYRRQRPIPWSTRMRKGCRTKQCPSSKPGHCSTFSGWCCRRLPEAWHFWKPSREKKSIHSWGGEHLPDMQ